MKFHTSLPVTNISKTKDFYSILFNTGPVKEKSNYLKYLPESIDLNISFIQSSKIHAGLHLGFEAKNLMELNAIQDRLKKEGLLESAKKEREDSVCCYAKQDKFWVNDPNGYEWEIYVLLEDTDEYTSKTSSCCG